MQRLWLILDCNYLAHRAKHVFGDLSDKGSATGVIYGFLRDILALKDQFNTNRFVFCWDYGESLRKKLLSTYKEHRKPKELTSEEKQFNEAFDRQVTKLRDEYLSAIGFANNFWQKGYESDDLIAEICKSIVPDVEQGIIITADQDLYQLISPNILWYNPRTRTMMTVGKFKKRYGITPKKWVKVKAIAGCTSDNVPGVQGIGEKTAIKYLRNELKRDSKAYQNIKRYWKDIVLRNRPLVQLPFKGTKPIRLAMDEEIKQEGWNKVTKSLGMRSIRYRSVV